jgi:hypothetical protein
MVRKLDLNDSNRRFRNDGLVNAISQRDVTECYNALKSARNVGITLLQVSWENPLLPS